MALKPSRLAPVLLKRIDNDERGKRRMSRQAEFEIDLCDSLQPLALLKVNQTLRQMRTGDRLEIRGADPSTFQALMRLLSQERFRITATQVQPEHYQIRLICQVSPAREEFDPADDETRQSERRPTK